MSARAKGIIAIAGNFLSGANQAIDRTCDLNNVDPDAPLMLYVAFPPGAVSGLVLSDADTGAQIINIGVGGNNQTFFCVFSTGQHPGIGGLSMAIQPPTGTDYRNFAFKRPKRLRIQISACGVGLQSYWELLGELLTGEIPSGPLS